MFKKISFSLALLALLSGCGIKPEKLQPPPGAEDMNFPKTYPDPATDGQL